MANAGTIRAGTGIALYVVSTFAGDITNSKGGVISAGRNAGIQVGFISGGQNSFVASFTGSVLNSGMITAKTGISVLDSTIQGAVTDGGTIFATSRGILVGSAGVVSGGIKVGSQGTISAGNTAVGVENTPSFGGGISNGGKITAARSGVFVSAVTDFSGGIVNSKGGIISAGIEGIFVEGVTTFGGGISNAGKMAGAGSGVDVSTIAAFGGGAGGGVTNTGTIAVHNSGIFIDAVSGFSGGVTNSGKISAGGIGILVKAVSSFAGDITNSSGGTISAGHVGIQVGFQGDPVASLVGNVVNSGAITARTGITVLGGSTIFGAIVDGGTIVATSHGILIDSASEILAGKTAVVIAGPTFTGGISNFGVISGSGGIEIKSAHPVSIFDAGAIVGTGGTAIEFAGSGNTLTLGAGYIISGVVDPSGNNTLPAWRDRLRYVRSQLNRNAIQGLHYLRCRGRHLDRHQREQRPLECRRRRAAGCERHGVDQHDGEQRRDASCRIRGHYQRRLHQSRRYGNHRVGRHGERRHRFERRHRGTRSAALRCRLASSSQPAASWRWVPARSSTVSPSAAA